MRSTNIVMIVLLTAACAERTPTEPGSRIDPRFDEVPAEYYTAMDGSSGLTAAWQGAEANATGWTAYKFANVGSASVHMSVFSGTTVVREKYDTAGFRIYRPINIAGAPDTLKAQVKTTMGESCGHSLDATSRHRVGVIYWADENLQGGRTIQDLSDQNNLEQAQPDCQEETQPIGGGSSDNPCGEMETCDECMLEQWALFRWNGYQWIQISEPWWQCANRVTSPANNLPVIQGGRLDRGISNGRDPVTLLVIPDDSRQFDGARSWIVRRSSGGALVILRQSYVSPQLIANTVAGLNAWERMDPNGLSTDKHPVQLSARKDLQVTEWAMSAFNKLRNAPKSDFESYGSVRSVTLFRK